MARDNAGTLHGLPMTRLMTVADDDTMSISMPLNVNEFDKNVIDPDTILKSLHIASLRTQHIAASS